MLAIAVLVVVLMLLAAVAWLTFGVYGRPAIAPPAAPDGPRAFGYKMAWLACRTDDTARVVELLQLESRTSANWATGVATIYDNRFNDRSIFVTPPVDGWTFVIGLSLPQPLGPAFVDKCTPLLTKLGATFDDVQYFFSYPPLEFFAWSRVCDGELRRAFATGDEGLIWDRGRATRAEQALGLKFYELQGVDNRQGDAGGAIILTPTEAQVMQLAARWSLDPSTLAGRDDLGAGIGIIATSPLHWRSELRTKRVA